MGRFVYAYGSPFWISDQGTNSTTLYPVTDSTDVNSPVPVFTVNIPTTGSRTPGPHGTGLQYERLVFPPDRPRRHERRSFIFADLNGTISAWNPGLGTNGSTAHVEVTTPGAVYTGLAVNEAHTMLYAANDSAGTIDVFDSNFDPVDLGDLGNHAFRTPGQIEARGLVPFNVTDIGGHVYVTYAPAGRDAQTMAGEGDGAVAIFTESGKLEPHGVLLGGPHTPLAAPWGVAIAPDNFGQFSGDLLVGNFSFLHSEINAFDPQTHQFEGTIPISAGSGHTPGGLWTLTFGGGGRDGSPNTLYFTDGIDGETHGLFGAIESDAANWSIDADASFRHVVGLIDAAWPFRWHDAAHTPRQLMSHRERQAATCAITRRGQTPARRGRLRLERPVLGTTLGRLHLCGRINRTINRGPLGVKPGLPPWGPHVRFRRVQTLVREGSPLVKLRNSA